MGTEPVDKAQQSEDYCFVCKDGGLLRLCDHKDCTKSYHPECVNKDHNFLDANETWTCGWHSCLNCGKRSTFKCFCCPTSFCLKCVRKAEFGQVKEAKGFCGECLRLAKLVEGCVNSDSDEEKVDFDDRNTWEFLFKDYWPIVKTKEGLTLENVQYADALLNRVNKGKHWSDPDVSSDQLEEASGSEDNCDLDDPPLMAYKWKRDRKSTKREKPKSGKIKFIGWGSVDLVKFLAALGMKTTEPFEMFDVYEIVKNYILSNSLLHLDKRGTKYVTSDSTLYCLVRRRKFKLSRLYSLLERHFASGYSSLDELSNGEEDAFAISKKRKRIPVFDLKVKQERHYHKELIMEPPKSCFAAITKNNIKAVYLKRSLIFDLIKDRKNFEKKVIGCFVRVKVDPNDLHGMHSKLYKLGQVTAVKKLPLEYKLKDMSTNVVLSISNILKDVKLCMLSDDDFEEEECGDLHQLVVTGIFQRPSIVDLEKKVRLVHEDIVKHSVMKELMKLDKLIERANEKGWRKDLFEYMDRKKFLNKPEELTRLVRELPKIVPDTSLTEDCHRTAVHCSGEIKQGEANTDEANISGASTH